jgi:hypothetical protein
MTNASPSFTRDVKPFSRDRLSVVSRDVAAKGAFTCLDHLQQEEPEVQVASVAILFAVWCKRLSLDPHALYQQGIKMVRPEMGHVKANVHLEVLRDFAGIRLAGDPSVDVR